MKLALTQFGVNAPRDFAAFVKRIDQLAAQAALAGADLLMLPEYFSMVLAGAQIKAPDIMAELAAVLGQADELLAALAQIAKRHEIFILGGTLPMRRGCHIINRAPFISAAGNLAFQDKQAMNRFEAERWGITGGAGPQVFATKFGKIGISICYDSEFPLHVRAQVNAGAMLILVPSCTDAQAGFNRVRLSCRARAIENQCFIAMSPLVGTAQWSGAIDENHGYAGLYGPADHGFPANGVLARGEMDEPALVFAQADFAALDKVRVAGSVLNHRDWQDAVPPCPVVALE